MDTAESPENQNNSNSSIPIQGSSRSNDSQNGNSEQGSGDLR